MVTTQELEQQEKQLNTIINEPQPVRRFGSGVDVRKQIAIQSGRKEQAKQQLKQVQEVKAVVQEQSISKEQALERISNISKKKASGLDASVYKRQIKRIALEAGFSGREARGFVKRYEQGLEVVKDQSSYNQTLTELNKQGLSPVYQDNKIVGFRDEVRGQTISVDRLPKDTAERLNVAGITTTETTTEQSKPIIIQKQTLVKEENNLQDSKFKKAYIKTNTFISDKIKRTGINPERTGKFLGSASKFSPFFLFNPKLRNLNSRISTQVGEGIAEDVIEKPVKNIAIFAGSFGVGSVTPILGNLIGSIPKGANILRGLDFTAKVGGVGALGYTGYTVTKEAVNEPEADKKIKIVAVGIKDLGLAGVGFRVGQKTYSNINDYIRTFNRQRVSEEVIVAPEFLSGKQTYPTIRKGQTAQELKEEFYNPVSQLGEIDRIPRGFTASPTSFAKETTTKAGSSELPGLYSAPRLSAKFLGLEKSARGYSLFKGSFFVVPKPTAIRLTFKSLEFTPNVNSYTNKPVTFLDTTKALFVNQKGTGKTLIPFIKTEKEAITVAETSITKISGDYYFKLEGRRVPIENYKVNKVNIESPSLSNKEDSLTLGKVLSRSSAGSSKDKPLLFPIIKSSSNSLSSSSNISIPSYSNSVSSGSSYSVSSSSSLSRPSSSSSPSYPPSSPPSYSPPSIPSYSPPSSPPSYSPPSIPSYSPPSSPPSNPRPPKYSSNKSFNKNYNKEIGNIIVEIRRQGQFRTVGTGLTLGQAKSLGINITNRSLARSVRFKGAGSQKINLPSIRYKAPARTSKLNISSVKTFVERSKYALSTRTELAEIGAYRR